MNRAFSYLKSEPDLVYSESGSLGAPSMVSIGG